MLFKNKKCIVPIFLTTFIVFLTHTLGYADITPVQDRTPQIRDAIVAAVPGVNSANDVTAAHLAAIATLEASKKSISALKAGDFDGLTALTTLDLSHNTITDISVLGSLTTLTALEMSHNTISDISVLKNLTKLKWLYLRHNAISDISVLKNLTKLKILWLSGNSISDISSLEKLTALRKLTLGGNSIEDISALEDLTPLNLLWLNGNAIRDVSPLEDLTSLTSLTLSGNPIADYAPLRRLKAANPDMSIDVDIDDNNNNAPVFTAGTSTTRSIAENTASGVNIGSPIAATDADTGDTLTYTLGGTDAASFRIVSTSGQLRTSAALDYETKSSYSVSVSVSDGNGGSDSIAVTINVTDVNENRAPAFSEGNSATRSVAENTASGTNIGSAVTATDADTGNTLTYTLGGTDASSFSIVSTSGQLQTNAALNYESKASYSVSVSVSDNNGGSDSIAVTINVTNVNEAPSFANSTATRSIAENTAANTNIGAALTATDVDGDTLAYTLGGTDASSFSIVSTSGQLQTSAALDRETKASYSVTVTATDGGNLSDTTTVTINVTNVNEAPTFASSTTTRSIAENTASGQNIGTAVAATDVDHTSLTYTLGGDDAAAFSIVSTTGQLQTSAALDRETKASYSVTVTASDGSLSDTTTVTINVTNVNEAPSFASSTATRSIAENTASGQNIGSAVSATDVDANTTLAYTLGGTDASSFSIVSTSGQLQTSVALDRETKASYSVTVTASDGSLSDTTTVTISVTDVNDAPVFTDGDSTTRSIAENSVANTNIGTPIAATDQDKKPDPVNPGQLIAKDTLTYSIPTTGDAAAFSIDSNTGQLKTKNALNYEDKNAYTVVVTASDGNLTDTISVTISVTNVNEAPAFATGTTISDISATNGTAITSVTLPEATDPDANTTLTYTLTPALPAGLTFTPSTRILSGTPTAVSASATYTYTASDSTLSDTLTFSIQVSAANSAPTFTDGTSTTRSIAENSDSGTDIGSAIAATDANNDTLTYTLGGTDAASFSIVSTTGQLQTDAALNYESKSSYSVSVSVSDNNGGSDSIAVTINVTNVNEAPSFASSTATRSIAENTTSGQNIGSAVTATDVDANTTLTYTLGGTDAASFSIVSTSGQLQTSAALDYETKNSYSVTVTAADGTGEGSLSTSIPVTITLTDANDAPVFTDGDTTTRSIAENTVANTNIGTVVTATDQDKKPDPVNPGQFIAKDTLTYSIPATGDAAAFSIDSNTGQLKTKDALNYENDTSYTVVVTASDGNLTDTITVTISVTDVNEAPTFATGTTISSISATNGTAITSVTLPEATDPDANTTLTYTVTPALPAGLTFTASTRILAGTPTAVSASTTYTYTASDSNLSATLTFTIQVSAPANNAPTFTDGATTTRSVAENTASGQNIGTAVAATDADNDTLTYTLGGDDASSFSIVSNTGQLQTSAALDRETKASYSVTITADDGNTTNNTDSIDVTINVTNVNEAPTFATTTATRSVAENTATNQNIGAALTATDVDSGTTLTYSIPTTGDAAAFSIDSNTGQLKTKDALNYENDNSYTVVVTASDGNLSDTITVTISVTNVNEAPSFSSSDRVTLSVAENTAANTNIGDAFQATDPDSGDTVTYSLQRADKTSFRIDANTGQLKTHAALDYETKTSYINLAVRATDSGGLVSSVLVTVNVTNVNDNSPVFTEGASTTRSIAENTAFGTNIGTPVAATDADNDTLSYTLGGTNAASFYIVGTSGQLRTGSATLDYETKSSYSVTINVSDGNGGSDSIAVTINVTDVDESPANSAPVFTDGTSTTRTVAENTALGTYVGSAVAATVANNATLTYTLGGADAASFIIDSSSGQLRTNAAIDYEVKNSYTVTVDVSGSNGGSDSITVTINVTDVAESPIAPPLSERTAQVRTAIVAAAPGVSNANDVTVAHLAAIALLDLSNKSISALQTGDFNGLTGMGSLYLAENSISDISALSGLTQLTHLYLAGNSISDISALSGLTSMVNLDLNNNSISNISALSGMTSMLSLALNNNSISDISALSGMTLMASLALNNNSISDISALSGMTSLLAVGVAGNPISDYAPLRTLKAANPILRIDISLNNNPPVFTEGTSTTRSVAERTASGTNIGNPVAATDADNHTLRYSLGGTDADSFSIVSTSGQLQTSGVLDYETNPSHTVTVFVNDGNSGGDSITVTINVTDVVDHDPVFTDGTSTTRSVAENTASGTNIGNPVAATDADNDTLTYTLGGTDAASFSIVSTSGQLQTNAALDYETTSSYSVTVNVNDGYGGSGSISVTINVTDVVEHDPVFTDGDTTTRSVAENAGRGTNVGSPVAATDANTGDTLTYTLGGTDAGSFSIVSTSGQLRTNATLDYETKSSYTVTVEVSDGTGGSDSITVTINVTDVEESTITPVKDRTTQVRTAIVAAVPGVDNADDVTEAHLAAITELNLQSKSITALKAGDFSGLTGLETLYLNHASANANEKNSISDISPLAGLTTLTRLQLSDNLISDISALSGMTSMRNLYLDNNSISDISALSGMTSMTILSMKNNNVTDVSPLSGMTSMFILSVAGNPISDYATLHTLQSHSLFRLDISLNNNPPTFTDGATTTRSVAENTAAGQNIGAAVAATDANNHTLSYTLGGTDADAFSIVSTSGQLQTKAALDYETKSSYTVTVTAYDGNNGGDRITVTINVTDAVGAAPVVLTPPAPVLPKTTELLSNYPNPFNPETWIPYQLAKPADVTITIYDIQGRVVRTLRLGHQPAGFYQNRSKAAHWNGRNYLGEKVATGVYFYTLKAGDYIATRKLLIRK